MARQGHVRRDSLERGLDVLVEHTGTQHRMPLHQFVPGVLPRLDIDCRERARDLPELHPRMRVSKPLEQHPSLHGREGIHLRTERLLRARGIRVFPEHRPVGRRRPARLHFIFDCHNDLSGGELRRS